MNDEHQRNTRWFAHNPVGPTRAPGRPGRAGGPAACVWPPEPLDACVDLVVIAGTDECVRRPTRTALRRGGCGHAAGASACCSYAAGCAPLACPYGWRSVLPDADTPPAHTVRYAQAAGCASGMSLRVAIRLAGCGHAAGAHGSVRPSGRLRLRHVPTWSDIRVYSFLFAFIRGSFPSGRSSFIVGFLSQ